MAPLTLRTRSGGWAAAGRACRKGGRWVSKSAPVGGEGNWKLPPPLGNAEVRGRPADTEDRASEPRIRASDAFGRLQGIGLASL